MNRQLAFLPPAALTGRTPGALLAAVLASGVAAVGLSGGCEFQTDLGEMYANIRPQRADLVANGHVKGQAVSGPGVVVSLPTVFRENTDLLISGTVTRRAGNDAPVPGFLNVQILSPDGKLVDESLLHWDPQAIPADGTRSARYHARLLGYPPAGSTVRVAYVEKVTDLESYSGTASGGGSAGGSRASSGRGGSHGGRH